MPDVSERLSAAKPAGHRISQLAVLALLLAATIMALVEPREMSPEGIPLATDVQWHTRNILQVIETVSSRQTSPPRVLIATDLIEYDCYEVSGDDLAMAGVAYDTYSATNPPSIVGYLQSTELRAG